MKDYPIERLEILAKFVKVDLASLMIWSDQSITIGCKDWVEYCVTKRKRKSGHLLGRQDGFYIYVNQIELRENL
jgi:hypothetical protein